MTKLNSRKKFSFSKKEKAKLLFIICLFALSVLFLFFSISVFNKKQEQKFRNVRNWLPHSNVFNYRTLLHKVFLPIMRSALEKSKKQKCEGVFAGVLQILLFCLSCNLSYNYMFNASYFFQQHHLCLRGKLVTSYQVWNFQSILYNNDMLSFTILFIV